jgi:hypothetical protein
MRGTGSRAEGGAASAFLSGRTQRAGPKTDAGSETLVAGGFAPCVR